MFESIINFFKNIKKQDKEQVKSKDAAKERLHLVLMQDRANVSADFLDLMKQEIIEVIKKYIEVDENSIDVRLTNKANVDGTTGAPALYANIPIVSLKDETKKINIERQKEEKAEEQQKEVKQEEVSDEEKNEEDETKVLPEEQEEVIEENKEDVINEETEENMTETEKENVENEDDKEVEVK